MVADSTVDLRGHPLVCSNDGGCYSQLWVLRVAGTHYPVLGNFHQYVNNEISSHLHVRDIDMALLSSDFESLMQINKVDSFDALLSNSVESSYKQCTDIAPADAMLRRPHLETELVVDNALLIQPSYKKRLMITLNMQAVAGSAYIRKAVIRVKLSENLGSEVWSRLKSYIAEQNPNAGSNKFIPLSHSLSLSLTHTHTHTRTCTHGHAHTHT